VSGACVCVVGTLGTRQYMDCLKRCLVVLLLRVSGDAKISHRHMRIYLDHNATTPPHPEVVDAVSRAMRDVIGNPSSVHAFGQEARAALEAARAEVATLIGASPSELVMTAGGTEANNFAIRGLAAALEGSERREIISSAIEHEAVLNTGRALARRGWTFTLLPVGPSGIVEPDALEAAISERTALVSVMHANNEIGTIQPIERLARLAHDHGAVMHTDAVQSVGKIPVDAHDLGVDLLSLAGHKFYGPKGTGALWIRRGTRLAALLTGGRQERNRRAGTENLPGIVGLGVAATLASGEREHEGDRLERLRDRLEQGILERVPGTAVNGAGSARVPNTTNISFERIEAESLLIALDLEGIAVSTGSACSSGTLEPSHVLKAMGLGTSRAQSSLRFSLGRGNTDADIDRVLEVLPTAVEKLRRLTRSAVGV
jgi:cysteine desulfurase